MTGNLSEEYRKVDETNEIMTILTNMQSDRVPLSGWQNTESGRILFDLAFGPINRFDGEIKLIPFKTNESIKRFIPDKLIYIHTSDYKFVTESSVIKSEDDHITIYPPLKIFVKELRIEERIKLGPYGNKVQIKKQGQNFTFNLVDISRSGMAFLIPVELGKIFGFPKDEIIVLKLLGQEMAKSMLGQIVYTRKVKDQPALRVGIRFYNEVDIGTYLANMRSDDDSE